jgi:hypothetical protein
MSHARELRNSRADAFADRDRCWLEPALGRLCWGFDAEGADPEPDPPVTGAGTECVAGAELPIETMPPAVGEGR